MNKFNYCIIALTILTSPLSFAADANCCKGMQGIQYCDSSSGRFVCANGYYSSCYCTRHAIMDLQKIEGCCLWKGGVLTVDHENGLVVCNNGGISNVCSLQKDSSNNVALY